MPATSLASADRSAGPAKVSARVQPLKPNLFRASNKCGPDPRDYIQESWQHPGKRAYRTCDFRTIFQMSGCTTHQALTAGPKHLDNIPNYFLDQGGTTPVIRAYAISCPIAEAACHRFDQRAIQQHYWGAGEVRTNFHGFHLSSSGATISSSPRFLEVNQNAHSIVFCSSPLSAIFRTNLFPSSRESRIRSVELFSSTRVSSPTEFFSRLMVWVHVPTSLPASIFKVRVINVCPLNSPCQTPANSSKFVRRLADCAIWTESKGNVRHPPTRRTKPSSVRARHRLLGTRWALFSRLMIRFSNAWPSSRPSE